MKKQKRVKSNATKPAYLQGIFGSGPAPKRINKKLLLIILVLLIGIGAYVVISNNDFGLFAKDADTEKGLMQATEIQESPATLPVSNESSTGQASPTDAADVEASAEGENSDPPVVTNQLPDGEEAAVDRAAAVDTTVDNHETEVMGGDN